VNETCRLERGRAGRSLSEFNLLRTPTACTRRFDCTTDQPRTRLEAWVLQCRSKTGAITCSLPSVLITTPYTLSMFSTSAENRTE
jgi:hypothetical protein